MPLKPGDLLNERYRIEGTLGQGGFGAVYGAVDEQLGVRCAVKENLSLSPGAERQFRREAQLLATLRHPNLPGVTNHFTIDNRQYLVMDYVKGDDSSGRLHREGTLPEQVVLGWIKQISSALSYLHGLDAPIIHRDVKPANIKITPEGQAILVDFGLAKDWSAGQTTSTGAKGITPGFAPPEQYDLGHTDARTDVYALGATLYVLLTAQHPPDSVDRLIGLSALIPPRMRRPELSPHVESAILRALEVKADQRFQSVDEFAAALADPDFRYEPAVELEPGAAEEGPPARRPAFDLGEWARRAAAEARRSLRSARQAARRRTPDALRAVGVLVALAVVFGGPTVILQRGRALVGIPERPLLAELEASALEPASFARQAPTPLPTSIATRIAAPTAVPLPTPTPRPVAVSAGNAAAWRLFTSWQAGEGRVPFTMGPEGDSLLLVDRQGVDTFDLRTGARVDELQGFLVGREVRQLGQVGNSVLVQFEDEILEYDLELKNLVQSLRVSGRDMQVSADGSMLAFRDRYVNLLSMESGNLVATVGEQESRQEYAFSPDGGLFALTRRNDVELYDAGSGRRLRILLGHGEPTGALAFTPDGERLVSVSGDVWEVDSGELVTVFDSAASLIAMSPDGQLAVGEDGAVWDLTSGERLALLPVQGANVLRQAFTPDGLFLVRQLGGGLIELWTVDPNVVLVESELASPALLRSGEPMTSLNVSRLAPRPALATGVPAELVISPGWTTAASWSGSTLTVVSLASGEELRELRVSGRILDVAYLGEEFLIVINAFRQVERWEVRTGRLMQSYDYQGHRVQASGSGDAFAVQEKYIQVVDRVSGERLHNLGSAVAVEQLYPELNRRLDELRKQGQDFAFSPDGEHLAIAFASGVGLWNVQTGGRVRSLSGHGPPTRALSFTPDGSRLLSGSGDVWDVETGKRIAEFEVEAEAVAISPSGDLIAGSDGSLWDGASGQYLGSLEFDATALWFTPDDRQLIVHRTDGRVIPYAIRPIAEHSAPVSSLEAGTALAELGLDTAPRLALVGWWGLDPLLEVRNERDGAAPGAANYGAGTYHYLTVSPGNNTLLAVDHRGVDFLDPATGRLVDRYRIFQNPETVREAAWLGEDLLLLKERAGIERWDLAGQRLIQRYDLAGEGLLASPDGRHFAVLRGNRLAVVEADSGELVAELTLTPGRGNYAFSPDGRMVAVARGAVAELWELASGARAGILYGHGPRVYGLTFSPDGVRLIAASGDIWELGSGERTATFAAAASGIAVSPQGTLFVGDRGAVRAVDGGERVATLIDVRVPAARLMFTGDGRQLIWHAVDGRIYVWGVPADPPPGPPSLGPAALTAEDVPGITLVNHFGKGRLLGAVWSPDEQYLAVNTVQNAIVYSAEGLDRVGAVLGAKALAFDRQGRVLIGGDRPLELIEPATMEPVRTFGQAGITAAAFSPDGTRLAIAGSVQAGGPADGLAVIELSDGAVRVLDNGRGRYPEPIGLEFTGDGSILVLSFYGAVYLWEVESASQLRQPIVGNTKPASFSPDGRLLAYFTDRFVIERLDTGGERRTINADGTPYFATGLDEPSLRPVDYGFSADGDLLVFYRRLIRRTFEEDLSLVAWQVEAAPLRFSVRLEGVLSLSEVTGVYAEQYANERPQRVPAFGMGPIGRRFYSLTGDGLVQVWSTGNGVLLGSSRADTLDRMALSPDGSRVAVPDGRGAIELLDAESGGLWRTLPGSWLPDWIAFGSDTTLAAVGQQGDLSVLDLSNGRVLDRYPLEGYAGPQYLTLAPDGRGHANLQLVAGQNRLQLFSLSELGVLLELGRYPLPHRPVFSPDGRTLAMVRRNEVELWDVQTAALVGRLEGAGGEIGELSFTPDGARLVAGSGEIWDLATGSLAARFEPAVRSERVVTNGYLIVSESRQIWDIRDGDHLGSLEGLEAPIANFAFTPDGSRLLLQLQGGVIELWGRSR